MKGTDYLKLLPSVVVTAGIVAFWYDDFMAFWIALIIWWITVPVAIAAIVFFFMSLKMDTIGKKVIVFYGAFNALLLAAYIIFGVPQQSCNPDIMEKHYEKHAEELDELCSYALNALDDSCGVTLEWEKGKLSRFHVCHPHNSNTADVNDTAVQSTEGCHSHYWNEDARSKQDSLMQVVGLTEEEFDGIHKRLKKAGCISIEASRTTPHKVEVGFRRVGFGCYYYIIYDTAMTDEEKARAMEWMELIPYNERVVFQFGGGAVGADAFGKEVRDEYMSKHKPW